MILDFPHVQQAGIFRYLFTFRNSEYWDLFNYSAFYFQKSYPQNAFNWDSSSYWYYSTATKETIPLDFCFHELKIFLTGYEVKTSAKDCTLSNWNFYVGNQYKIYDKSKNTQITLSKNGIGYTEWNPGIYQCFRFEVNEQSTLSNCGSYGRDR